MRVHYDIWTDSCIAKWHVFLRNNQSTHPCRRENISIHKQKTTSRADAHHQIFFSSVFLFPFFSWITFHPDSLPWPVLTTCRLEESPCDRTGKISIPLHNAPSDLWVSKLGKKALDRVFRSNEKLLTSQTGTPQGDLVFKADAIISWKKPHWTGLLQYLFGLTKSLLIQNLSFISSLENKTKPTKSKNFFR